MKKKSILFLSALLTLSVFGAYEEGSSMFKEEVSVTDEFLDYKVSDSKFTVISVQKDGMSKEDTKQSALTRAAQITKDHGFRYFRVESEHEVGVYVNKPNWPTQGDFPGNLYEEDIQEHGFDRDRVYQEDYAGAREYPGYQIVFECFQDKPSSDAHDSCNYLDCKK